MKDQKERPSKSQNPHSFRISKMAPKIPPSPNNASNLAKTYRKDLYLEVPKTPQPYTSKSDYPDHRSARSSQCDSSERQVDQSAVSNLLEILMSKGLKLKQMISVEGQQLSKWMTSSQSLKIKVQNIFQKLVDQRRLGVDLKGLNAGIINQIERGLANTLSLEMALYQKEKEFVQYKNEISQSLQQYKAELIRQIETISAE